jgi:hypothetical protein
MARSPSIWISRVDIERRFGCVAGHVLPIAVDSTAYVRLAGPYRFRMTYRYESVNGRVVTPDRSGC